MMVMVMVMVMMVHLYIALFRIIGRPLASKQRYTPSSRSSSFIPGWLVWCNKLISHLAITDPSHRDWQMVSKRWQPLWISKPVISKTLNSLRLRKEVQTALQMLCGWCYLYHTLRLSWCLLPVLIYSFLGHASISTSGVMFYVHVHYWL